MAEPQNEKQAAVTKQIENRKARNLERALKEERLALTAIGMAFVQSHGDVDRFLTQMEAMVRAAVENPRVKPKVKQALIDGQKILERSLAIHKGKPQPLFTDDLRPNTGHVNASDAKALANPPQEQQVGLFGAEGAEDAIAAHEERQQTAKKIDEHIIRLIRENEPMTDVELYDVYCGSEAPARIPWDVFYAHRTELTRLGRVVDNGDRRFVRGRMRPVWDLIERTALTA